MGFVVDVTEILGKATLNRPATAAAKRIKFDHDQSLGPSGRGYLCESTRGKQRSPGVAAARR